MTEKEIRNRITELRMSQPNLSEAKLGLKIGMSTSYIQSISSGRASPSMKAFLKICEYFDISLSEFFEERLPSPAKRVLRKEIEDLDDEDIEHLIYIVRKMKKMNKPEEENEA